MRRERPVIVLITALQSTKLLYYILLTLKAMTNHYIRKLIPELGLYK